MRLDNKVAIVTGAGSGIGAASALLFAQEGAKVLAVDRPGSAIDGMTRAVFSDPSIAAVRAKKSALRRLGQPIDLARAALLLASDEADFITGHGLIVDGGLTLRV